VEWQVASFADLLAPNSDAFLVRSDLQFGSGAELVKKLEDLANRLLAFQNISDELL
jgi:hypothetical protein